MKTLTLASLFATSILVGCAEQPSTPGAELSAGENGQDGEAPKADGVDNFGFLAVHKVACTGPAQWCTTLTLDRVNRSTTDCFPGVTAATCGVHGIEWSFSDAKIAKLEAAIASETSTSGPKVLVRGEFKRFVEFVEFVPSEVWIAQRDAGTDAGTYVRIFDRGIRCITAPCPQYEEGRLNSTRQAAIDGFDYGTSADDALQEQVYSATTTASGVIFVGDRTYHGQNDKLRSANQVFLPFK